MITAPTQPRSATSYFAQQIEAELQSMSHAAGAELARAADENDKIVAMAVGIELLRCKHKISKIGRGDR